MTKPRQIPDAHMLLCPTWAPPDPRGTFIALALEGEASELANLFKKEWRDGMNAERRDEMARELGDVVAYARMMGKHLGIDVIKQSDKQLAAFEKRPGYRKLLREAKRRTKEAMMGVANGRSRP